MDDKILGKYQLYIFISIYIHDMAWQSLQNILLDKARLCLAVCVLPSSDVSIGVPRLDYTSLLKRKSSNNMC